MADLVEKYFQEDLTEAEQEALSGSLLSSDDAALKFEKMAGEAYARYGLPEPRPQWPNDPPPSSKPPLSGLGPWIGLSLAVLGVGAAALLWTFHPASFLGKGKPMGATTGKASTSLKPPGASLPASSATGSLTAVLLKKDSIKKAGGTSTVPVDPLGASHPGVLSQAFSGSRVPEASEIKPGSSSNTGSAALPAAAALPVYSPRPPINLDQNPSQSYSGISLEVKLAGPSPLLVQVLDSQDNIRAVLYQGTLGAGKWVFVWDGQLNDGRSAPAGFYQIQVHSGLFVQSKKIQIQ